MGKPIKREVRELLFRMIRNFQNVKEQEDLILAQKRQCFQDIEAFAESISTDLTPHLKTAIQKLKDLEQVATTYEKQYMKKLSDISGVSERTLREIKQEGQSNEGIWRTPGKKRASRPTKINIDNFDQCAIRNKINEFYLMKKEVPTLQKLLMALRESIKFDGCRETLRKILQNMGYEFSKNAEERTVLMEKDEIVEWRSRYIRKILQLRRETEDANKKTIVYVDETYVHVNYKPKKSWQGPSTSKMLENLSKGKRFIIVHAGTENGFVENALLVFSTKAKHADYHDDMNAANFSKWVLEKLLPNLSSPSVIVFDNASYHSIQINRAPTSNSTKQVIRDWLTVNNIMWSEELNKIELYCLVKRNKPDPIYHIDELLRSHGHEVLRLPPYHCHLNPIEMVWSQVKRKIAEKNVKSTIAEMMPKIEEAFACVTAEHWKKYVDHVKRLEIEHHEKDSSIYDVDSFVINVQDSDDEESHEESIQYEGIEYLDSFSSSNED